MYSIERRYESGASAAVKVESLYTCLVAMSIPKPVDCH